MVWVQSQFFPDIFSLLAYKVVGKKLGHLKLFGVSALRCREQQKINLTARTGLNIV